MAPDCDEILLRLSFHERQADNASAQMELSRDEMASLPSLIPKQRQYVRKF
jgi:hypothetical protein